METANELSQPHIGREDLQQLIANGSLKIKSPELKAHVKQCEHCQELLQIVERAMKIAGGAAASESGKQPSRLELDQMIVRIYERDLDSSEAANFLYYVAHSDRVFGFFEQSIRESIAPVPAELEELSEISIADRARELIKEMKENDVPAELKVTRRSFELRWSPKLALGLAALLLLVFVGYAGMRYYNTTYQMSQARSQLQEMVSFYVKDKARLSGDYAPRPIDVAMSSENNQTSPFAEVLDRVERALENGTSPAKARQLQAQVFILQNDLGKADSVLSLIPDDQSRMATVLNDRGVLHFLNDEWQRAADYFDAAIKADAGLKEAYYNLALALEKLHRQGEAIQVLERYLELETDEGWRRAGQDFLRRLKQAATDG